MHRKYKFWEWVSDLPRIKRSALINSLAAAAGVQRRLVTWWLDIPLGSKSTISYDAVVAMCKVLEKDPATALNTAPVAATPALAQ